MRHLVQCAAGLPLLIACGDPDGMPTDQGTGYCGEPSLQ